MSEEKVLVEMSRKDFDKIKHMIAVYAKQRAACRDSYHRKHDAEPKKRIFTHRRTETVCPQMKLVTT